MKNRNIFYSLFALLAMLMLASGCNNGETMPVPPQELQVPTWRVAIDASSAEGGSTRALVLGEDKKLYTFWTENDPVKALSGTTEAGTLTASIPDATNMTQAKLIGTLTGTFAVNDVLTLWYPDYNMTYDGQTGTLAAISAANTFLTAQSQVTEVDATNGVLKMSNANFSHLQSFLNLTFTDTENAPLYITKLEVWTDGGKLVKSKVFSTTTFASSSSPLVVNTTPATNQFFLSLRDEQGAQNKFHFFATTSGGAFYAGTANSNLQAGHYYKGTLKLSPSTIGREGYGNDTGWDSDGSGSVGRDGYDNGIGWDDLGMVQAGRDNYGLGAGIDSNGSGDTSRDEYGDGDNWDGIGSGDTNRDNYGAGDNIDSNGSSSIGRDNYGTGTSF